TLYQIYPRSFHDTNGDGIGDLPGITERLDYVAGLGVDGIWLSPFYPSPMHDFGYDVTDLSCVDPQYGDLDDFHRLAERAHELGLKIIIDAVLNHTSIDHPWFEESRQNRDNAKADWYIWHDPKEDGSPPNNWISRFAESQWTWCPTREQYYRHQYMREQPALNLDQPEVVEARLGFMRTWLDRGVDGIRFDAVTQYHADPDCRDNPPADPRDDDISPVGSFNSFAFQRHEHDCNHPRSVKFVENLMDEITCAGCTFAFGEIDIRYEAYDSLKRLTGPGLLNSGYTPEFMEMSLVPSELAGIMERVENASGFDCHVWALTNHDASRIVSRWGSDDDDAEAQQRLACLAAALMVSLPGQLTFFQGEELGLPDADYSRDELRDPQGIRFWPKGKGRDPIRHPFPWTGEQGGGFTSGEPWLAIKDDILDLNRQSQEDRDVSPLRVWREAIHLRRENSVLRLGDCKLVEADDASCTFALARTDGDKRLQAWFAFGTPSRPLPDDCGEVILRSQGSLDQRYSYILMQE
ncbi:MAG: alpha-amylase family glycosyl hydrolase, partial [Parvularcula sp.]|nr:alpha-amylase family glycosyl hydrolase [Parvularcula sp.]